LLADELALYVQLLNQHLVSSAGDAVWGEVQAVCLQHQMRVAGAELVPSSGQEAETSAQLQLCHCSQDTHTPDVQQCYEQSEH
jgi:hypothetical protein